MGRLGILGQKVIRSPLHTVPIGPIALLFILIEGISHHPHFIDVEVSPFGGGTFLLLRQGHPLLGWRPNLTSYISITLHLDVLQGMRLLLKNA